MNDDRIVNNDDEHVPPETVAGAHDADGTTGRVAGTGSGAIAGGIVGSAAGPIGTVVGAVAGALLGSAAGDAAHKIGSDHDDVNVETGSGGDLGRAAGTGAGSISGAIIGSTAGPVGTVVGAVAGGVLGAAAGDGAKDMGGDTDDPNVVPSTYAPNATVGTTADGTAYTGSAIGTGAGVSGFASDAGSVGNDVPGIQTGGYTTAGADTRGIGEKAADTITGDRVDDKTGGVTGGTASTGAYGMGADTNVGSTGMTGIGAGTSTGMNLSGDANLVSGPEGTSPTGSNYDSGVQVPTNVGPDGTPDTRGFGEKLADAATGNHVDDKTGNPVGGINTGGHAYDGTADTRGITEKTADVITGDRTDDKTGKTV